MKNKIFSLVLLLAIPAFIMLSCTKEEEDTNTPPTASFTVTPGSGNIQTEFELDPMASSDAETAASQLLMRWDLNDDGTWESEYEPISLTIATYGQEGNYTIRLEVRDAGGLTASTTMEVNVSSNLSPSVPSDPDPADAATDIATDVTLSWVSTDPEQDPVSFDIYFGNTENPPLNSAGLSTQNYTPGALANNTTYYWKVVAFDDQGNSTEGPVWSFTTAGAVFTCGNTVTDPRNGETYPTVQIGDQCWMAKNMNIGEMIDGSLDMSNDGSIEKYCYDNDPANCDNFGGLYQWSEMLQYSGDNIQGICPDGWHAPSLEEWQILEMALGMTQAQATATSGWQGTDEGDQLKEGGTSGFEALLSGNRNTSGNFTVIGLGTAFWTGTQASSFMATARTLDESHAQISHTNYDKRYGHAVRCMKD